ncbi:MAG TPA: site-specific integrase [Terriglobales bacterium]|nr:site-specific integrase [Terriglobales bacterium]
MTGQTTVQPKARRKVAKVRGVFERSKGSDLWWIRYTDAGGREHREKAGTRGMALDLLAKRRAERLQGVKLPETLNRRTVLVRNLLDAAAAHVREHYSTVRMSAKTGRPATDSRYPALAAALGDRAAATLTPLEVERALAKLATERAWANATVNRHKAFLSLAYRIGIENSQVQHNPVRAVRQRREDNGRIRFLSPEDEARLRSVIRQGCPEHEPELDLALNTGLRQGNQYGLQWPDVDFERRQVAVARTKNGQAHYAPLNQAAIEALLRLKALAGGSPWVIVNAADGKGRYRGLPRRKPRSWFEPAVAKAGLGQFPWHCLRHTFASRLVMAGVDIRTVAELMGHRTLAMTMRYAHLAPRHRLDAVERLASFAGVQTGTRTGTGAVGDAEAEAGGSEQVVAIQ